MVVTPLRSVYQLARFYLDDWYIMLNYKALGAASFKGFLLQTGRCLATSEVFVPIFKDSRLGWQAFALVTHLAAYSFFLALTTIEPSLKNTGMGFIDVSRVPRIRIPLVLRDVQSGFPADGTLFLLVLDDGQSRNLQG